MLLQYPVYAGRWPPSNIDIEGGEGEGGRGRSDISSSRERRGEAGDIYYSEP